MTIRLTGLSAALAFFFANLLCGDVTIRYQSDFQPSTSMPPGMTDQVFKPAQASSPVSLRIKGSKALATAGSMTTITDLAKQEVTLIDPARRIFATIPASQFAGTMAAALPQLSANPAAASVRMRTKTSSKTTGRTDTIEGIQAEEREIAFSVEMEMPGGAPQMGPLIKCILQIWTASPLETLRVAALRELSGFSAVQNYLTNPVEMLRKVMATLPGAEDGMTALVEEMRKNSSLVLRTHMEMYMPFLGAMANKMAEPKGQPITGGFDPNAPLMRMNQEVVEISSAPVEGSLFEIPKEFSSAPAEELLKGLIQSMSQAVR